MSTPTHATQSTRHADSQSRETCDHLTTALLDLSKNVAVLLDRYIAV